MSLSGLRGAKNVSVAFRIVFRIFFLRFSNRFSYQFKSFSGAISFCRHAALSICIRIWFELIHQEPFPRMCIRICYKINSAKSARYVYRIRTRWCSEIFTYMYVYWIRTSGPKTKECTCVFSCWDGFWDSQTRDFVPTGPDKTSTNILCTNFRTQPGFQDISTKFLGYPC